MKTLLIDNYDSFTFNLYQLCAEACGVPPIVVRNDISWEELKELDFDNVVVSPGPGRPERDADFGVCKRVIQDASVPILGVCLGHQGIGHLHGGVVRHAPQVMHGRTSQVFHDGSHLFAGLPQGFTVVRYHSLMVTDLPDCLVRTAWTSDGILMGMSHRELPLWGVQFHPESICSEYGRQLIENFNELTRQYHRVRGRASPPEGHRPPRSVVPVGREERGFSERFVIHSRRLELHPEPEAAFIHLFGGEPRAFWLDSSKLEPGLSRFSFMGGGDGPESLEVRYHVQPRELLVTHGGRTVRRDEGLFTFLRRELARRHVRSEELPFDFNGGFVGYLGYELKVDCGAEGPHASPLPDAHLLLADRLLAFDGQERVTYLVCLAREGGEDAAKAWLDEMEGRLRSLPPMPPLPEAHSEVPLVFHLERGQARYLDDIGACQRDIQNGETYEVCLTNKLHASLQVEPLTYYRVLRRISPTPYAAFLRFGETAVACSSPERFLRVECDGTVESKPIKGTVPRSYNDQEDALLKEELRSNEKDRSENLMIVDLVRNDLGLVCEVGSVHVPKLMDVESYSTVHQLVSTIRGRLRSDMTAVDCIQAAFPGGSMTGAPKKRTLEIIDRLEGSARGPYSGAIGFLGLGGGADLNIVIRTAVIRPGDISIGVGGAVVALSDPQAEYEEILLKARAMLRSTALTVQGWFDPERCSIQAEPAKEES